MSSFRVHGKIFATLAPDGSFLNVFVDDEQRELMVAVDPKAYETLWWGKKVVGLHVHVHGGEEQPCRTAPAQRLGAQSAEEAREVMNVRVWLVAAAIPCAALALVLFGRPDSVSVAPQTTRDVPAPTLASAVADRAPAVLASSGAEEAPPVAVEEVPAEPASSTALAVPSSPLPGQGMPGPMTQLLLDGQKEPPAPLVANERVFETESIDADWAPLAEARILDTFAQQAGLRLVDLRVACRTTMCRVQMMQPRGSEKDVPPLTLLTKLGYQPRFIIALDNQAGGRGSIAYLMRPGTEPPGMSTNHATEPTQQP